MAIAYQGAAVKSSYTANATLATTDVISVAIGDVLVVGLTTNDAAVEPTGIADTAGNGFTACTKVANGNAILTVYYSVATVSEANNLFTGSFTASAATKAVWVATFRPDSGETISLDFTTSGGSTWEETPWETSASNMSANADDAVGIAYFICSSAKTYSDQAIGGHASTVLTGANTSGTYFYYIFGSNEDNVAATSSVAATAGYSARLLIFKSLASGGSVVPQISLFYNRLRND